MNTEPQLSGPKQECEHAAKQAGMHHLEKGFRLVQEYT